MKGLKLICINAGNRMACLRLGMHPLKEGKTYTVRGEEVYGKGTGYLLEEIINDSYMHEGRAKEPGYAKHRFIPLSDIDEKQTMILTKEVAL